MLDVSELNRCAHDFEESSFERFDEIYDNVINGTISLEEKNIAELCGIFSAPFSEVHPQQYHKIHDIAYTAVEQVGEERGFYLLIGGLLDIPKEYAVDFLRMIKWNKDYLPAFEKALAQFDVEKQDIIRQYIKEW